MDGGRSFVVDVHRRALPLMPRLNPVTNHDPRSTIELDAMLRQPHAIVVGPHLAAQLLCEPLLVPHLDVIDAPEHAHVADNRSALAEMRRNHDPSLPVELGRLAVVIDAIEKLE